MIKSPGNFRSWYVCETFLFNALRCCYSIDHSTPASQSPHSSNPSSLPSSPPTHNHNSVPFSNFGPIGTPDNRDRRTADRWKTDKPGESQSSLLSRSELTGFVSFLGASTAGLLTPALGEESSSAVKIVEDRSGLVRGLIKLRKPVFRKSRFFFSSPPSLSSWDSEPLADHRLWFKRKSCWVYCNESLSKSHSK